MSTILGALILSVSVLLGTWAAAQQPVSRRDGLFESKAADGLKEALRVGTDHAVVRTGKKDGYFGNKLIKILLPDSLQPVESGLRLAGYGSQVDELILSMNRAAEKAAPFAKDIFVQAITAMTFEDVMKIVNGGDTAATDFFQRKTSGRLYKAFRPVIDQTMHQVGTVQKYNEVVAGVDNIPFVKKESLDIGNYVTEKALDGLFVIVAEEERQIRKNPAARVTSLLQQVFGR